MRPAPARPDRTAPGRAPASRCADFRLAGPVGGCLRRSVPVPHEVQPEFLFADGPASEVPLPDPRSGFNADVADLWQLPVGQLVHVDLTGHQFSELRGRLELARAPDLPLDRREALALRIGPIEFTSCQIAAWTLP